MLDASHAFFGRLEVSEAGSIWIVREKVSRAASRTKSGWNVSSKGWLNSPVLANVEHVDPDRPPVQ